MANTEATDTEATDTDVGATAAHAVTSAPATPPTTLSIDIGGTGLKASVLNSTGAMTVPAVRIPTVYPCPPTELVSRLVGLVAPLGRFDRISAGFPGMVRGGLVLSAPHFVTVAGPGTDEVPELLAAWDRFDLAGALSTALGSPARVVNDADMQGAAVVSGHGLEFVITLGTGMGSGLFLDGHLAPHLELAHHPFRHGETYNEQLGDAALRQIGTLRWKQRVMRAVTTLYSLLRYDRLYVGGGNARHLDAGDLGTNVTIVDNAAGILGGIRLWDRDIV